MANEHLLQIDPADVRVSDSGAVEIINQKLAAAIKERLTAVRPGTLAASNNGCNNNLYQCKPQQQQA